MPPGGAGEADAVAARITFEEVSPATSDEYEAAVKGVAGSLGRAKSPVTRLAFTSSYGTGEYVTLWLARSAADLEATLAAAPAQAELASAIEKERAKTVRSATRVAFLRRELSTR